MRWEASRAGRTNGNEEFIMAQYRVEADLRPPFPGLVIGIDNIKMPARKRRNIVGPFLIIARACGLALDAEGGLDPGNIPHLRPPHAQPYQLWLLRSSGHEGEAIIQSSASGLALDSRRPEKHWVQLREREEEAWQRWRAIDSADGVGYLLQSTHNGKFLTANDKSVSGWCPWFENRHGHLSQQWIIAAPHSNVKR
jgi:hypothetical protein